MLNLPSKARSQVQNIGAHTQGKDQGQDDYKFFFRATCESVTQDIVTYCKQQLNLSIHELVSLLTFPAEDTANNMLDKCKSEVLFFPTYIIKKQVNTQDRKSETGHMYKTVKLSNFFHLQDQVITDFC